MSQRTAKAIAAPPLTRRKWLDIALAAVLIVGMLGGSFWYGRVRIGSDGPSEPQATHYAAQPLSSLSTPDVEADHTASDSFDPSAEHEVIHLGDESPEAPQFAALSGSILVVSGTAPEWTDLDTNGLTAIDLETRQVIWSSGTEPLWPFVIDEGRVFGGFKLTFGDDAADSDEIRMMAFNLETGETAWTGPELMDAASGLSVMAPTVPQNVFQPTIIGSLLYYIAWNGEIIALDAATGAQEWTVPLSDDAGADGWKRGGAVVGDEQAIYAVDSKNVIRKLAPLTGDEIDRFPLEDRPSDEFLVQLHFSNEALFALSMTKLLEGSTTFVDAIDTDNGDILWSDRVGLAGYPASGEDILAVSQMFSVSEIEATDSDIEKTGIYASFIDENSGELIGRYGPADGGYAMVSWSGDVACINEALAIHCADFTESDPEFIELPYAPGGESFAPLLFWNDTAIVLSERDGVVLLQPKDVQPQQAQTTGEAEARGGSFGSADRSLVVTDLESIDGPLSLAWSRTISDTLWALPYGDVVATLGSSEIMVQDATTGEVLWSKPTSEAFRNSTYDTGRNPTTLLGTRQGQPVALPWIVGDTMYYAGTSDLIGVDLHTGEEVFRTVHTVPGEDTDPEFPWDMVVKDGTAYILTLPAIGYWELHAVELDSGEILWSHKLGETRRDWILTTTMVNKLVVTDSAVVMQVSGEEDAFVALSTVDGSVLWEQANTLVGERSVTTQSSYSAVDNDYLVLMERTGGFGETDSTPTPDQSLGIAVYDIETGEVLWKTSDNDFGRSGIEEATCGLATGWAGSVLYIACTADDELGLIGMDIDTGDVTYSESIGTETLTYLMFQDRDHNLYYGGEKTLTRLDPVNHQMDHLHLEGGNACVPNAASNEVVICHTDDGLGTYGIQVYAHGSAAMPQASPAVSDVQRDAREALLTNDPAQNGPLMKLPGIRVSPQVAVISDDTLLISGQVLQSIGSDTITYGTQAIDLPSGDELWFTDTGLTGDVAIDDANVYGFELEPTTSFSSGNLVAFSLATGDLQWRIYAQPSAEVNAYLFSERLLKVESNLYVPFENGSVNTYDLSGDLVWSYNSGLPFQRDWILAENPLAGDESAIYISNRAGEIRKLDRLTGELVDTISLSAYAAPESWIDLHMQGSTLIAIPHPPAPLEPNTSESVVAMSTDTGEILWTQEFDYQTGRALVTGDLIAIPQYILGEGRTRQEVVFYDLAMGEVRHAIEIDSTASPLLSASGNTICLHTSRVECGPPDNMQPIVLGRVALPSEIGQTVPVMYWDDRLIIVNPISGVYITQP